MTDRHRSVRIGLMGLALGLAALLMVWASPPPAAWAQTATVQLNPAIVNTGQTIAYEASFTPTSTLVDIYMGCLLPDGFTFVSFIGSFQTGTIVSFALGPSITPAFGNATLPGPGVFVAPFSYTFTGGEPIGTYFCYAGLVFAGNNPFVESNRLTLDVKAFQFMPTSPPPPPPPSRPTLDRLVATRTVHSFGRADEFRSEGVATRPGFFPLNPISGTPASALLAPRLTTLGPYDSQGNPDPTNPLLLAAAALPPCCTLLVAEGASPGASFHWETDPGIFRGTYYSTGIDSSGGFPFGAKITDLSAYNRNSIFMELPSIPFPVLNNILQGGSTHQGVHVHDVPPPFNVEPPRNHTSDSVFSEELEYDRAIHMEIGSSVRVGNTFPPTPDFPDGGFLVDFPVTIFGRSFPGSPGGSPLTIRIDCGGQKTIPNITLADAQLPVPDQGPHTFTIIDCPYGRDETSASPTVVASTPGTAAGGNPFIFPLNPVPSGFDMFDSRGCTVGERGSLSFKPPSPCSEVQEQGADTPETRTIELGRTSGTFRFDFQTFTQQDRMIVTYGGSVLFDTGCVGTSGSQMLTYSGSSTTVTVQVFPNCAGGTGTAWNFTVHCPLP